MPKSKTYICDKKDISKWTGKEWASFLKHKKIGNQQRVVPSTSEPSYQYTDNTVMQKSKTYIYDKKDISKWTGKEWAVFLKHKKIGNQQRVVPSQIAKKMIADFESGKWTGMDFANAKPQQLKDTYGLKDVDCNRLQTAKQAHKGKQQAHKQQQQGAMPTTVPKLPDGEIKINITLQNGRSDTVIAYRDWTVPQLMKAIKDKCVVPDGFNILINGNRFRKTDTKKTLEDTGLNAQNLTVRPVTGVKGG